MNFTLSRAMSSGLCIVFATACSLFSLMLPSVTFAAASGWVSAADEVLGDDVSCGASSALIDFQTVDYVSEAVVVPQSITVQIYDLTTGAIVNTVNASGASLSGTTCLNADTEGMIYTITGGANYYNFQGNYWVETPATAFYGKRIRAHIHLRPLAFATQDIAHIAPTGGQIFENEPSYRLALNSFTNTHNATGVYRILLYVQEPSGAVNKYTIPTSGGSGTYTLPPRGFTAEGTYFWGFYVQLNGTSVAESHTPMSAFSGWSAFRIARTDMKAGSGSFVYGALQEGKSLYFKEYVINDNGPAISSAFTNRFQIDINNNGSIDVTLLPDPSLAGLPCCLSSTRVESGTWSNIPEGTHRVIFCADHTNAIAESDETNNCSTRTFTVLPALPDLTIAVAPSPSGTLVSGNPITFQGEVQNMGGGDNVGYFTSIAIGQDGFPVIAYYNATDDALNFTKCTNTSCSSMVTASPTSANSGGQYTSVTIGADGYPVLSYSDRNSDLQFAKCSNASCSSMTTARLGVYSDVADTSIAIGSDGFPVIAYYNGSTFADLVLAKCNDTSCSSAVTSEIDTTGDVGRYASIAIGQDGFPVIAYYQNNAVLKFAKCNNISCSSVVTSTLDAVGEVGLYTSITIGSDGFPVISYWDRTNGDLKLAKCNNASCSSVTISTLDATADNVGLHTSIAIGQDGFPVIAYFDFTNFNLKLAKCNNSSCSSVTISTLDTTGDVGRYASIAIGQDGFPVIAYRDHTHSNLKFAKCGNVSCSPVVTSTLDSLGRTAVSGTYENRFEIDLGNDGTVDTTLTPHPTLANTAAGASAVVTSGSWTALEGDHRVILCADQPTPNIDESNETNNCSPFGTGLFTVTPAPQPPAVFVSVTPEAVNTTQTFRVTMTSTNATSCTWSRSGSYAGNWSGQLVPAPNTSYDSGAIGPWAIGNATWTFVCTNAIGESAPASGSVTVSGSPVLSVIPPQRDFGAVAVNTIATQNFTVTNTGAAGSFLKGKVTSSDPHFTCVAGCDYSATGIAEGALNALTTTIRFAPGSTAGDSSGYITFTGTNTSPASSVNRLVLGTGVIPISGSGLDFGNVIVGKTKELPLTITNGGSTTLVDTLFTPPSVYTCVSSCALNIPAGSSQDVTIRFTPTAVTRYDGNASLTSYPSVIFPFTGAGVRETLRFEER